MTDFEIRTATEADVAVILALIKDLAEYERLAHEVVATERGLRDSLFGERRVAEAILGCFRGEAVAFALFFHSFSTFLGKPGLYLEDLFVKPAYRGRGFGSTMLRHVASIAKERDCGRLEWSVLDWNAPALRFYRNLGALPLKDWIVHRLTGEALENLAR